MTGFSLLARTIFNAKPLFTLPRAGLQLSTTTGLVGNTQERPDILAHNVPKIGVVTCFDVSITNPACKTGIQNRSHERPKAMLNRVANIKNNHYKEPLRANGYHFMPLVSEVFGAHGDDIKRLFTSLFGKHVKTPHEELVPNPNCLIWSTPNPKTFWKHSLNIAIWKHTAYGINFVLNEYMKRHPDVEIANYGHDEESDMGSIYAQ